MCNCGGRARPDVITSQQAQADQAERIRQDAEANIAMMIASAANATANASSGWYLAPEE